METEVKTTGVLGGFADAGAVRTRYRAAAVLPRSCDSGYRVAAAKRDARPKLQLRTGASNGTDQLTDDSIARMPRWRRWGLRALCVLALSGVLPMAAASLLIALCDLVGWWLLIPLYIVAGRALWRVALS